MLPSIVLLLLMFLGLGITLSKHGQPETGNHNIFISMLSNGIVLSILWWGGFFDKLIAAILGGG